MERQLAGTTASLIEDTLTYQWSRIIERKSQSQLEDENNKTTKQSFTPYDFQKSATECQLRRQLEGKRSFSHNFSVKKSRVKKKTL